MLSEIKQSPVTYGIFILLLIIHYLSVFINKLDTMSGFPTELLHQFVHYGRNHLAFNLIIWFQMIPVESRVGYQIYLKLISSLIVINYLILNVGFNLLWFKCFQTDLWSMFGFSGVIMGLLVFSYRKYQLRVESWCVNYWLLMVMITLWLCPILQIVSGCLSGWLLSMIWSVDSSVLLRTRVRRI